MDPQFCIRDGCQKIAIGTGVRPVEHCREHYVDTYGHEFQQFKVTVPWREMGIDREDMPIACAKTGEDVCEGGTVWLDPVNTKILGLISAGLIAPAEPPKAPPKASRGA